MSPSPSKSELASGDEGVRRRLRSRLIHAAPMHTVIGTSHLSMEFPKQNFRGLYNLIILLLIVNLTRMVAENVQKYGLIIPAPWRFISRADLNCSLQVTALIFGNIAFSFFLKSASSLGYGLNFVVGFLMPLYVIWCSERANPMIGMLLITNALVYFLKTISFLAVTKELQGLKQTDQQLVTEGIYRCDQSFNEGSAFIYFLAAPTLCYQPSYPRSSCTRPLYVLKNLLRLLSCFAGMYVIAHQFIVPTLRNSVAPLEQRNIVRIAERILKLSLSSLAEWLLGFYAIFHCWLNVVAEALRFADRNFYQDWWNAGNIEEYWRLWNAPVHNWLKRHMYRPLRKRGCPLWLASLLVFLLSAVVHEVIFSVPLRAVHFWAFSAMLFQLPLVLVTRCLLPSMPPAIGNMFFWSSFCLIGQPVGILLYYWSYYERYVIGSPKRLRPSLWW
jgi:diacylglycerol O-acyltransferase-1